MPNYGFICEKCAKSKKKSKNGGKFEVFLCMSDYSPAQLCPYCHSESHVKRDFIKNNCFINLVNK